MKLSNDDLKNLSFAVYGLGKTGRSVVNFLKKKKAKNLFAWDDNKKNRFNKKEKINEYFFSKILDTSKFIIISPGINIYKSCFRKKLIKNYNKIITDIDLFYLTKDLQKTIVITGTNGKSTACKLIEHILKRKGLKVSLAGNIGKPIMDIAFKKSNVNIIEASSFQLNYSKFIKPTHAAILNLTKDHLDWHKDFKNYTNSKLKIFSEQNKKDYAFLWDKKLIKLFKNKEFHGTLKIINPFKFNRVKNQIKNLYLVSKTNELNTNFVYQICKFFKVSDKQFINFSNSFKSLEHRQEIFYKKNNINFINDSKATSFVSTKYALMSFKNIFWIVGGLPKVGDKFDLSSYKTNIIKAYIIGSKPNFFKKKLNNKIKYEICYSLKRAINNIIKDISTQNLPKKNILLSPASASYDQFKNFEERGKFFKYLIKKNARKFF